MARGVWQRGKFLSLLRPASVRNAAFAGICTVAVTAILAAVSFAGDDNANSSLPQKIDAQLAAGEFGPALDAVQQEPIPAAKSALLGQIAAAQVDAGEFAAAAGSIRRMPLPEARGRAANERTSRQSLSGGAQADFGPLLNLIQMETSGPWSDTAGEGGTIVPFETGVRVDAQGLLSRMTREEQKNRLRSLGVQARKADLNTDMAKSSSLRLVSLTRLEKEVAKRIAEGKPVLETMKHFAGISKIQYVFVYPEESEIIIGGPAEGWKYNENGQPVGVESGRPTLQLDDFVTVLRTFAPGGSGLFQCLIVPREEGLKNIKEFVERSQAKGALNASSVNGWVAQLQKQLGLQDIQVNGVAANSRVARVIVEADYRMKLIGIGRLDGGSNIPDYFELMKATGQTSSQSINALRWWMSPKCDAVLHSPDRNVFEIQGASVLCQSENELITDTGKRVQTGKSEATNRLFAENFTKHYADLAERDLVFADLENVFDLSLVAALVEHERLAERAQWDLGVFARSGEYRPATFAPAETVMSVVNHRVFNGKEIVVQVAGGVRADLVALLKDSSIVKEVGRLASMASRGKAGQLPEGRWWWDAAR